MITNKKKSYQLQNEEQRERVSTDGILQVPEQYRKPEDVSLEQPSGIRYEWNMFGPLVAKFQLPNDIISHLLEDSKKQLLDFENTDYRQNLAGHLKEEVVNSVAGREYFIEKCEHHLKAYMDICFRLQPFDYFPIEIGLGKLWTNFMKAGEFNPPHVHSGHYSMVIFLDVPDDIEKSNEGHRANSPAPGTLNFTYGEEQPLIMTKKVVVPKTGDMYIFPASLRHAVYPFKGDSTRVSMSGNIYLGFDINRPNTDHQTRFMSALPPGYWKDIPISKYDNESVSGPIGK